MRLETRSVWKQQIGAEPRKLSRPREPIRDDQEPKKMRGTSPVGLTAERPKEEICVGGINKKTPLSVAQIGGGAQSFGLGIPSD
jgi:hypothetical protein